MNRLEQQIEFCKEIDKQKFIGRQSYLSDGKRRENDAEHAWHAALMAIILSEYSNEKIDLLKTVTMILMHDLVEIDAGDTYAYDEKNNQTKDEREQQAANRIFGLLPPDQKDKFHSLWQEFEACETPEAKFARTLDNFQPTMLNQLTSGILWAENNIKISQILNRNKNTALGSALLWEYSLENFIKPNLDSNQIINDTPNI